MHAKIYLETVKKRGHLEALGVDRKIILKLDLKGMAREGVDRINVVHWLAFMNMEMNNLFP